MKTHEGAGVEISPVLRPGSFTSREDSLYTLDKRVYSPHNRCGGSEEQKYPAITGTRTPNPRPASSTDRNELQHMLF
jgi:hypothetical protein